MRTFNAQIVYDTSTALTKSHSSIDSVEWISNSANICLHNDSGDVALFTAEYPRLVTGHYYFQSRGRRALQAGQEFLDEVFDPCYNIEVIRGLTPLENLGARWVSRQLGFTSHGVMKTDIGPHELFILHRKDHNPNG